MQLEKAKETKQDMERCRLLAQRIAEELAPATAAVLNAETPALEKALHRAGVDANPFTVAARQADLLVVEDPAWVEMPAQLPGQVLLVFTGSNVAEGWAEELARRGYYRDFRWRSRGRAQQSALYCTVQPATAEMIAGYEKELDLLRDRMVRAERTCNEEAALIERLRSDLSLSRSHAKNLEKTLNEVTSSTFWKLTWPMRYVVSKSRQIWHTFPLFVLLGELRRDGISGVREHARARREYAALFPGNLLRADRFAPVELLVRQANDQPAGPKISIVVPLYNTPLDFLDFEYSLLTNRDGPLARKAIRDLSELDKYMEILHDDFQLPGEEGGDGVRWHVNPERRIHVYERCSQFSILQRLPTAYMWASPMPRRALEQYHLVLKKCPAQRQQMRDVLVYPDKGRLRPEEQAFVDLLHKEAASTVK